MSTGLIYIRLTSSPYKDVWCECNRQESSWNFYDAHKSQPKKKGGATWIREPLTQGSRAVEEEYKSKW